MIVAGVMSGTSADGVDVALCRIMPSAKKNGTPRIKLIGAAGFRYPKPLRNAVLAVMDAKDASVADLSRLNWRLGEVYAGAVERAAQQFGIKVALVGCHGQTIYHQGAALKYLGRPIRCTWQLGEASVIAEKLRVPVVSDFRPADLAAGGQGAPLVPILDYVMFRSEKVNRVLQNLGGIANMTAIPAGASIDDLLAFDSGPSNMVIDACMERFYGKPFDRNGAIAKRGKVIQQVIHPFLKQPYFSALPPKSCGREEYGEKFVNHFISLCRKVGAKDADIIATATALSAESILDAYRRFVWPHLGQKAPMARGVEYVVAGGGAKNETLMTMLRSGLEPLGVRIRTTEELGIPTQAKEGVAFALMAWLTWNGLSGNVPSATGAPRPVILGKVTRG
ncbi:anhydro-N-acetylmuramic acid kinase [Edaphobacter albus]|uniref:anhydro-N-acetylmuramic acid kinase n=1 Tax=Edaphobacter sp. 4G125 TaxID=2763071 RepID=UPI001644C964|nr:anhydro-N-acetylmuramic acid kinase [Edaphobacter sp. 4G125]QNI35418.1 anhydro-N-acetylmuramic acid kinase [Edaphobacter sp. 4G125]